MKARCASGEKPCDGKCRDGAHRSPGRWPPQHVIPASATRPKWLRWLVDDHVRGRITERLPTPSWTIRIGPPYRWRVPDLQLLRVVGARPGTWLRSPTVVRLICTSTNTPRQRSTSPTRPLNAPAAGSFGRTPQRSWATTACQASAPTAPSPVMQYRDDGYSAGSAAELFQVRSGWSSHGDQ